VATELKAKPITNSETVLLKIFTFLTPYPI